MKFGVARFDIDGQFSGALDSEASDGWASRLSRNIKHNTLIVRYTTKGILWIDTIKFPLFLFSQEAKFYSNVSIVGR